MILLLLLLAPPRRRANVPTAVKVTTFSNKFCNNINKTCQHTHTYVHTATEASRRAQFFAQTDSVENAPPR